MTQEEQTDAFHKDLRALVARYRKEFSLTLATAIWVLHVMILELFNEQEPD